MVKTIEKFPANSLSVVAQPAVVDEETRSLVSDMVETMFSHKGIGLSAPQVGVSKRVIIVQIDGNPVALINPVITEAGSRVQSFEACLSIPRQVVEIRRYSKVTVEGLDIEGNPITLQAEGMLAIALQHELDHLDGKLISDRIVPSQRALFRVALNKKQPGTWRAAA